MDTALTCSFSMHDPLRNSLPVKVRHFVGENHILNKKGPPVPHCHGVQLVPYWMTGPSGEDIRVLREHERKRVQEGQYKKTKQKRC